MYAPCMRPASSLGRSIRAFSFAYCNSRYFMTFAPFRSSRATRAAPRTTLGRAAFRRPGEKKPTAELQNEAHRPKRAELHRVDHRLAPGDLQAPGLEPQEVAIPADVLADALVAPEPVDHEVGLDAELVLRALDDPDVADHPARARRRILRVRVPVLEARDARPEAARVVGDGEQGVPGLGVGTVVRRDPVARVGSEQAEPLVETPFVEESRLPVKEVFDLGARDLRRAARFTRHVPASASACPTAARTRASAAHRC